MIKVILPLVCAAFLLSACTTSYNQKNYKKYRGISYEQYEQEKQRKLLETETLNNSIDQSDISAPEVAEQTFIEDIVESAQSTYGDAVVIMATKKIQLGRAATASDMSVFQTALDSAYKTALRKYRAAGFTYAMSPAGTVNPLSTMDVQCILSEASANALGKATCDLFFQEIPLEYENEKAKSNDTL